MKKILLLLAAIVLCIGSLKGQSIFPLSKANCEKIGFFFTPEEVKQNFLIKEQNEKVLKPQLREVKANLVATRKNLEQTKEAIVKLEEINKKDSANFKTEIALVKGDLIQCQRQSNTKDLEIHLLSDQLAAEQKSKVKFFKGLKTGAIVGVAATIIGIIIIN